MNIKRSMLYKILVMVVIFLFIGVALSPVITAVDNEPIDNSDEIGASEDYKEIITYIGGSCYDVFLNRKGIIRDVELFSMSGGTIIDIRGWRRKSSGFGLESFSEINIDYLHAPRFLGIIYSHGPSAFAVNGIAFGNIEWS